MEDLTGIPCPRIPVDSESITFHKWNISYNKSHILKSLCDKNCAADDPNSCELCVYRHALCNTLPHLPDMVFHKNNLTLVHENGAKLEFTPMESLKRVKNESDVIKVACSTEWKESRPKALTEEKVKPFDWTFTTDYQGTINEKFVVEPTDARINMFKLMQRENILFYHDLTLFEDELHDHGISVSSAKIRVMPSGFFVLLRNFVRVDGVVIRINDTRYHYETDNKFILKEYTCRESQVEKLKSVPPALFTEPNEIAQLLPIVKSKSEKLIFLTD